MKLQDLINVADTDVYISSYDLACNNLVQFVPVGDLLKGCSFVMNLTVRGIDLFYDACALIAWVDLPGEFFPELIKYNNGFSVTLERDLL